jgi:hypothetical protein
VWLAAGTSSSGPGTITVAIITALGVLLAAGIAGFFTLRGSTRTNNTARVTQFDQRVDEELDERRARVVALEQSGAAKDMTIVDLQNRLIYARYLLANASIDPTILDGPEAGRGRRYP